MEDLPRDRSLTVYVVTVREKQIHRPEHYDFWMGRLSRWAKRTRRWGWCYPHYTNSEGALHPHYHVGIPSGPRAVFEELQEVFAVEDGVVSDQSVWYLGTEEARRRALWYIFRGEDRRAARLEYQPKGFRALRRFGAWDCYTSPLADEVMRGSVTRQGTGHQVQGIEALSSAFPLDAPRFTWNVHELSGDLRASALTTKIEPPYPAVRLSHVTGYSS